MKKAFVWIWMAVQLSSCGGGEPDLGPSVSVQNYLNDMVDIMEENSINRKSIDWTAFRNAVLAEAGMVETIAEANPAVLLALELLGEQTSFVVTTSGETLSASEGCTDDEAPEVPEDPAIGYIKVPTYGATGLAAAIFAQTMQGEVQTQDDAALKGWIIDLRGNTGGNMWPMLAGVGPLLGEDVLGYFVDADGTKTSFQYAAGTMKYGEESILTVAFPYSTLSGNKKIAVLVDEATASSGEAVAIAFIGRSEVRIFGSNTCGKSAGNQPYVLADGSVLYLTTANLADRNSNVFTGKITPDEPVDDPAQVYPAAANWINE